MISSRIVGCMLLCAGNLILSSFAKADTPQYNVIWMIADDIGFDLRAYQNTYARTPVLDRMTREGVQFWRFYTPSAVCSPSRVGFSTGQHPAELGVFTTLHSNPLVNNEYNSQLGIPDHTQTIYQILGANGYQTAHAGKWHRGSRAGYGPADKGVDEFYSYAIPGGRRSADLEALYLSGPTPYYSQIDSRLTDWSIDYIERTNTPFFLEISFHTPHMPLHPARESVDEMDHLKGFVAHAHRGLEPPTITPAQVYYGALKALDDNVGRLFDALEDKGIEDETIIIFTGDNGPASPRSATTSFAAYGSTGQHRGNKGTVYEGGIRVPLVVKGPGFAQNVDMYEAISGSDILPSLLSVLGISSQETFYGEDMSAMFYGNDIRRENPLHWMTVQNKPSLEHVANLSPVLAMYDPDTDMKCLMQINGDRPEAYNTHNDNDPAELDNLVGRSAAASRCLRDLEDWYIQLPDPKAVRPNAGNLYYFRDRQ